MCARARHVLLIDRLKKLTDEKDYVALIESGVVHVNGSVMTNPRARIPSDAAVSIRRPRPLRGAAKLTAALEHFRVTADGAVAVDVGASTGGFTHALLEAGASRVYAVDVGFGQLLGSLRQDSRVVVCERTNLAELDRRLVPEPVDVLTIDVSYVSLATALPQLGRLQLASGARLIALVKPMYELGLQRPPESAAQLLAAVDQVRRVLRRLPWSGAEVMRSPVQTGSGAQELLLYARRR